MEPFPNISINETLNYHLESTDAALEVPHRRPMRLDAGRGVWRGCSRVGPRLCFFFFFFLGFAPTQLDSCRIGFDSCRIGFNSCRTRRIRPKSSRIGHIGSYRPTADTAKVGRKRPKHAGNGRNRSWIWPEKLKLAFFFLFFVNQGIVMCFLRIF